MNRAGAPPRICMFTIDQKITRRILQEAESLIAAGFDLRVVAAHCADSSDDPPYVERIGQASGETGSLKGLWSFYRWLRDQSKRWGGDINWLRAIIWRHFFDPEALYLRYFRAAIEREEADIYTAHDLPLLAVAAQAAARHGGKLVYDSHELWSEQGFRPAERDLWQRIEGRLIGRCDAVVTVNPGIASELADRYGVPIPTVIYNAVPVAGSRAAPRGRLQKVLGLPEDTRIILFQGTMIPDRGLEIVIEAHAGLTLPDVHLVFLGDGEYRRTLMAAVDPAKVGERVHFLDAVPQRDLLPYTASASLGVVPYRADCLNTELCTPSKLFEYLGVGVPVVVSDLPELRRLVEQHDLGVVWPGSDAASLAVALDSLLRDPERLVRHREACLRAREVVSWEREADKLVALYRGLLTPSAGGGDVDRRAAG